jgi:glycosyltransferase involved in cell wall biosynthesis
VSALDSERLRSTLESLIEISNLDIEHITVLPPDDKDSIELWNEICSGKKNFHLLHDENQGIYKAMNIGGQAATGKFIVFWNSGERITSYRQVELLIDQLRICEFPQFISQGEIEWIPVHIQNDETYRMFIEGELGGFISHQTYFIDRKHFLNIGGFSSSFRVAADTDLILRMESEELTISTDVCPVFVQNSQFASLNNRIARLEILKISTTHGFRTKSFVRVSNTLRSEIRSWMKTLHRIFETPLSDNKLHHANSQNVSNTIYAENFGRNAILKCFQSSVLSNFKQTEIRRVAIVGGYL